MNTVVSQARTTADDVRLSARGLLSAVRPRQWPKNLLVFGAPAAAGMLFELSALIDASLAFLAFTLAASGTYLINDAYDAPYDRLHPTKRNRAVAAGLITSRTAVTFGVIFILTSLVPAVMIGSLDFVMALVAYVVLTASYTLWLKQIAVVDLVAIASGFGLRAVGGAFAIAVHISQWFLIVSFFGALFVVAGKRFGEQQSLGLGAAAHRKTLASYAESYAQHVMTLSSGITLVGYGLWAHDHGFLSDWWFLGSLMVLVTTLLRFSLLVHTGVSDDPVEIMWRDKTLRVLAIIFLTLVVFGIELS
jgi:decaprenyl-phosphate phosphoribosyltransferase